MGGKHVYPLKHVPCAVIIVTMLLFFTGNTIEVFKCIYISRRRHSTYPRVENASFFEPECFVVLR